MTSTVPNAVQHTDAQPPITMFGPDFPYAYDDFLAHPAGLGQIPATEHGTEVAVIGGGLSGIVAAYELMKMGLKPVVYEADQIGGRLRTVGFDGCDPSLTAEMGAMRFPPSSTALQHYIDLVGLRTEPFPNPLSPATPSTVVDLKGESHYAETIADLPQVYRDVMDAWNACLEEGADFSDMNRAMRERDVPRIREIWAKLVEKLDNQTFYGFLCASDAFKSFRHREIFGQVGFGTGGWDTDFPNSILEILRVVYTEADDHHRGIVGGSQQLPLRLWEREPQKIVHWPLGTSLSSLHDGEPRPAVTRLHRTAGQPDHRHRRDRRHPHLPGGDLHRASPGCCSPRSTATTRCSPSTTGRRWSAPTTWSRRSCSCLSTGRSGWTRPSTTGGSHGPRRHVDDAHRPDDPRHVPPRRRARQAGRHLPLVHLVRRQPEVAAALRRTSAWRSC